MTEFVHDNLKYEINEWGNVRSMSIFYEKVPQNNMRDFFISI